jgi:hypothetical protein
MDAHESIDFEDEIRRHWRAEPFVPFDIVVTGGDCYEIQEPGQVAWGGDTVVAVLPKPGSVFSGRTRSTPCTCTTSRRGGRRRARR